MPKGNGKPIPKVVVKRNLSLAQGVELVKTLKMRFSKNLFATKKGLEWAKIEAKIKTDKKSLSSLYAMESTGGEPDVVGFDKKTGEYIFYDCSPETPEGRRNVVYDREAEIKREKKGVFPGGNVIDICHEMGIELLSEEQYRELQKLGKFDAKTSSWLKTPLNIRKLGGAIFADYRFGTVFVYHNGADSFYGARGFRGLLRV